MAFDLQGHRGARGLAPENTLAAFAKALEIGVTTLETDLAVTRDGVLVLSHDPVLNPDIVRGADGQWLAAPGPAINSLTLAELGALRHRPHRPVEQVRAVSFPRRCPPTAQRIPTLAQLFELAARFGQDAAVQHRDQAVARQAGRERRMPKPSPAWWWRRCAPPGSSGAPPSSPSTGARCWRQDGWRPRSRPSASPTRRPCRTGPTAATAGPRRGLPGSIRPTYGGSVPRLAAAAGCGTWSPYFKELSAAAVAEAHALGLKVVPWTVNAREDLARIIDMKADGLITDYPDRAREVMAEKGVPLP